VTWEASLRAAPSRAHHGGVTLRSPACDGCDGGVIGGAKDGHRRFPGTSFLVERCAWWPALARGRPCTRACRRDGLDRGRSLRLHGICRRPGRPPAAGRLATCRPRVPLGRASGPGPARHATPANVRSRLRARPLSSPSRRPPGGGRGARLGPSRPSTACAPAERCGQGRSVRAAVPGGPGTGVSDDPGAVFADAQRPRARRRQRPSKRSPGTLTPSNAQIREAGDQPARQRGPSAAGKRSSRTAIRR
jgi:hypothetical protein